MTESANTPLLRLLRIYRDAGFQIQTGLNSYHFHGWRDAPFTLLYRNGRLIDTGGGGLSIHEIPFLEHLSLIANARSIFVIGNSFGWSSLLLSILWPKAEVVALDCGLLPPSHWSQRLLERVRRLVAGPEELEPVTPDFGITLTNQLARDHALNVRVICGFSPRDVQRVVTEHLSEKPDLVLIDGYHTPDQVLLDFKAASEIASSECLYLFHDVLNWRLDRSFDQIAKTPGLEGRILWRTTSGIGFAWPVSRAAEFQELVQAFDESPQIVERFRSRIRRRMMADKLTQAILHSRIANGIKRLLTPGK